ncbi:DUF4837 family protein [uncultured Winogradskyella sp.]|uniref:DUF4837 family protein n=1 Tax=uncultured Winogradskyella sp. TaxID=395353 RepID=UPI0026370D6E|nr:DUF4837 family protein [uncultured Winogradskyella sp.]
MRIVYTLFICALLVACGEEKKEDRTTYLPASNGNLNSISVVIDNQLWDGNVGETIRSVFAAPINGLPVDEPKFMIRQIPPQVFDGFATRSRIVLKIEKGDDASETKVVKDAFAKPQTLAVIGGLTNDAIISQIKTIKVKIIDAFNKEEVKEKQRRISLSLLADEKMEKQLGFSIDIPSAYRISKAAEDFFWVRKNLSTSKTIELMFYEVPLNSISKGDSTIVDIINVRNNITKTKIPGEDDIYMAVDDIYAPSMFKTIIDNKPAYEVRGLWRMQGYTMAGPFITYVIEDKVNERYLIADGYVYAPSLNKSEYVFELEAIIKSIKIK